MDSFWNAALKYNAPATIAGYIFWSLMSSVLERSEILKYDWRLQLILILIIFNFCALMLFFFMNKKASRGDQKKLEGNTVSENEIGEDLVVGSKGESCNMGKIKNNKISKNKVGKDMVIGEKNN